MFIDRIQALVAGYEDGWLGLKAAENEARRRLWTGGGHAAEHALVDCRLALDARHADDALYDQVQEALLAAPDDPWLARSLEIVWSRVAGSRGEGPRRRRLLELETALEARQVDAFSGLREVLGDSTLEEEREAAWAAMGRAGADLAPRLLEQARLRAERAEELGYPDWTRASLELDQLPADALLRGRERLADALEAFEEDDGARLELAARWRRRPDALAPWHRDGLWGAGTGDLPETVAALAKRDPVDPALDTFDALGLDPRPLLATLTRVSGRLPGGGLCLGAAGHALLLLDARGGAAGARSLLAGLALAFGHHAADPTLPALLREPAHSALGAAVARLVSDLLDHPWWLQRVAGLDGALEAPLLPRLVHHGRRRRRQRLRLALATARLEEALTGAPEDLPELAWTLAERHLEIERPRGRQPGAEWAAWPGLGLGGDRALLSEGLAAQLAAALERSAGPAGLVAGPEAGGWLADRVLQHGASLHWEDLIEQASGEPFSYGWALLRAGVPLRSAEEPVEAEEN